MKLNNTSLFPFLFHTFCRDSVDSDPRIGSIKCNPGQASIAHCSIIFNDVCANIENVAGAICVPETSENTLYAL